MKVNFFANGLSSACHLAQNDLIEFRIYHQEVEKIWSQKNEELQEKVSKELEQAPEEHHEDIFHNNSWELHLAQYKYPSIHRESLVLTIYNFLEDQLNDLCETLAESIEHQVRLKDLNGRGTERAKLYLSRVAGFDLSKFGAEMGHINSVNQLRNQIVHSGSTLPEKADDRLNRFVEKSPFLSGNPGERVAIDAGFVEELTEVLQRFFQALDGEVQSYIQRCKEDQE